MSTSHSNKLLKLKRERKQSKTDLSTKKLDSQSGEYEVEDDNNEDNKQENSLGQLTINFLQYIKKKGRENININDLVKELKVKKRRIYDITNVLQGIGYIIKKGKNEIVWTKSYKSQKNESNKNSLPENYISNCNKLKTELDELRKEDKLVEEELNKYNEEFNYLSKKKDFPKYGYITFNDIKNISKSDNLDFIIIKAGKGTMINVIDDEESKKAYMKIKNQMEKGKIEENYQLLSTLENLHHIFFVTKDEKIRIYRVEKGEITETLKEGNKCAENSNKDQASNNNSTPNQIKNNNSEKNNLINIKNNIIFKEKESLQENPVPNIKENINNKNNIFNFDNNNCQIPIKNLGNNTSIGNYNNNNNSSGMNRGENNNKQFFTFGEEHQSLNNNSNSLNKINKSLNSNKDTNINEDIKENKFGYLGISSLFK